MNTFTTAIALAALIGSPTQDPVLEGKAVTRVQQTPASQYDPTLPARTFGSWFNQLVGPRAGVTWRLTECVQQAGADTDGAKDIPACVEVNAILPDERMVIAQILTGSFGLGLSAKIRFHFAGVEDGGRFRIARKLSDLPQLLRPAVPKTRLGITELPRLRTTRAPQLYIAKSPMLVSPPETTPVGIDADMPPPPSPDGALRVSRGVSVGDTVTRVMPVYPAFARQIGASGEVQVEIIIDEDGQVVEAKAVSGHPSLRLAAEDAARKWVFKPTLLSGKPVKQQGVLNFIFARPQ